LPHFLQAGNCLPQIPYNNFKDYLSFLTESFNTFIEESILFLFESALKVTESFTALL